MSYTAQLFESLRRSAVGTAESLENEPTLGFSNASAAQEAMSSSRLKGVDIDSAQVRFAQLFLQLRENY